VRAIAPIVVLAVLGGGCGGSEIRLRVTPASAPVDQPLEINATGFRADERVTLIVEGRADSGAVWHGRKVAAVGGDGRLVLHSQYLLGRYGAGQGSGGLAPWPRKFMVTVRGREGSASVSVQRAPPLLRSIARTAERPRNLGFFGEWIRPRAAVRRTAVLVMGGSDGGLSAYTESIASALTGHGYPALALAYFNEPGLPNGLARIRLEYFRRALGWMRRQREVDPNRIVTLGVSRGGELSLILASTYPRLVHATVGYVPIEFVVAGYPDSSQPAWIYRGKPYEGDHLRIPVERTSGPVFVAGGGDDQLWPSGRAVAAIIARMRAHGRTDVTALTYPGAGHALGTAVPIQLNNTATTAVPPGFGGSARADELAREDSWPKLLRFLKRL
jgi:dienelactone hydrolase